jgi:hypothetical protein
LEGQPLGEFQERFFMGRDRGCRRVGVGDGVNQLGVRILQLQEIGVTLRSVDAAVKSGNVRRQHFFYPAGEMSLRKMYTTGKGDDIQQEIRPRAKTFEDTGDLGIAGCLQILTIDFRQPAGGFCLINPADARRECGRPKRFSPSKRSTWIL